MATKKKPEETLPALQDDNMLPTAADVPDYLREEAGAGTQSMSQYKSLSRVKICHGTSRAEIQEVFDIGTMFISPDEIPLCEFGEKVDVVPIFFYPSWAKHYDSDDPEAQTVPVAMETFDPADEIAKKAKAMAQEPYENNPKLSYSYVEHLNFLVQIQEGEAAGMLALVDFSRGSAKLGKRLCGYYDRLPVPIYGCRIELYVDKTANKQQQMYYRPGWRVARPQFVSKEQLAELKAIHAGIADAYNARTIGTAEPA